MYGKAETGEESAFDKREPADAGFARVREIRLGTIFTAFGDVVFQRSEVFIVDPWNAFRGETAELW